ncbi:hypothetical protein [Escherichia coli]|uniref:hypothetical protein n=1 Tax=Escherichia coli TaxID=562 RepID=UPI0039A10D72
MWVRQHERDTGSGDGGLTTAERQVVDLCDSELDHRIALQFGGGNEEMPVNILSICGLFQLQMLY